jgi:hypothetical protein
MANFLVALSSFWLVCGILGYFLGLHRRDKDVGLLTLHLKYGWSLWSTMLILYLVLGPLLFLLEVLDGMRKAK